MIDIIIPVLNEEKMLAERVAYYAQLGRWARVIFVDGGSTDRTAELVGQYGEVIVSATGRGRQKNAGAAAARSECLLFLHIDTIIDQMAFKSIEQAFRDGADSGCLHMNIDDSGIIFRLYEWAVNGRASLFGVIDGDLGMFVRKDVFERLGGFDEVVVMEDILFAKKMRRAGRARVLPQTILVSSRKWHERGFLRTFCDYTLAYLRLWGDRIPRQSQDQPTATLGVVVGESRGRGA